MHLLFQKICVEPQLPFSSRALLVVPVKLLEHKIIVFPQRSKNKIKVKGCDSRGIN